MATCGTCSRLFSSSARHIGPTLIARYDDEAPRPWPTGDFGLRWAWPLGEAQNKAWKDLDGWFFAGAGSGASSFWRPWALPHVPQPFAIAVLTGSTGVGKSHLAEALSRQLDGSLQLAACTGRWAALRLRLRVKAQDCLWWRRRQPADPWDSGYLVEDPAARRRLERFLPRRATLIVADELPPESLRQAIEDLNSRRSDFRHLVWNTHRTPRSLARRIGECAGCPLRQAFRRAGGLDEGGAGVLGVGRRERGCVDRSRQMAGSGRAAGLAAG